MGVQVHVSENVAIFCYFKVFESFFWDCSRTIVSFLVFLVNDLRIKGN